MSTKDMINTLIDGFSEAQLKNVLTMLESLKAMIDEAEDDAFCGKLYADSRNDGDNDAVELSDFAKELGISLS